MSITGLKQIWDVISLELPKDQWIAIIDIYELVQRKIDLTDDDQLPAAPNNKEPKWKRNVRNVLQHRKTTGELAWDKDGRYMIPTEGIALFEDGIATTSKPHVKRNYKISQESFRRLQEARELIGALGEEWVVDYERRQLTAAGRDDLATTVQRISINNVGAGYDVLSYDKNGNEKFIEVKTTVLSKSIFQISANELRVAAEMGEKFWIYFVSELRGEPALITIQNPSRHIGSKIRLTPITYEAQIDTR